MTLLEYFNECNNKEGYITVGGHYEYKVINGVLYFPPTDGGLDWKDNFRFAVVPYKNMEHKFYVHKGFLKIWKELQDKVAGETFHTIIGYSQGGTPAPLAYEDTLYRKGIKCECIVFGAPKFLWMPNKETKERFSGVKRIITETDIVTHVPPTVFGYQHIGQEYVLTPVGKKPKDVNWFAWKSGHDRSMYRQHLEGVELW